MGCGTLSPCHFRVVKIFQKQSPEHISVLFLFCFHIFFFLTKSRSFIVVSFSFTGPNGFVSLIFSSCLLSCPHYFVKLFVFLTLFLSFWLFCFLLFGVLVAEPRYITLNSIPAFFLFLRQNLTVTKLLKLGLNL